MTTEMPATAGTAAATPAGGTATRVSERGAATRSGLLAAAREVFISTGYAQAGVTDIVAQAGTAVRAARNAGITDPKLLFLAAARSYLDGCFEQRELSRLFVSGDAPPGFDVVMR